MYLGRVLWGVSYGGEERGQSSRPRSLLSSLNEAKCREVLSLGLRFPARDSGCTFLAAWAEQEGPRWSSVSGGTEKKWPETLL